jgi:hypothetical protein
MPEQWLDVALYPAPVVSDRGRLFRCHSFGKVEIAEFLYRCGLPIGRPHGTWIPALNHFAQKSQRFFARLFWRPGRPMAANGVPALTSADAVFEEVVSRATIPTTRPEARQFVIPDYGCDS